MRDAGVGGDFLKPDRLRPPAEETALGGLQDRAPSLRSASTPSSSGPAPSGASPKVASGTTAARLSRPGSHPP
jgi:hypothetical protein